MSKLFLIISVFSLTLINGDSIDDIVNKIKAERESKLNKKDLTHINSPIPTVVVVDKNSSISDANNSLTKIESETFILKAIVNDMAYINDTWVKKGEKIGSFKLVDIMDDSVYLKDKSRTKMIFFKKNNSKIKITGR